MRRPTSVTSLMSTAGASEHHRRAIERRAMSLRVLVIGAGRMGRVHLDAMRGSDHVEPVAVVEPFAASREQLADSGLALYASLDEALAAGGFDAALIAAPTGLHRDLVDQLMTAGVPTLCEKPCGLKSTDTQH